MSLSTEFVPQEVSADYLNKARQVLLPVLRKAVDADFMPGSLTGDCVATPIFTGAAVLDEGVDRFLSDLLLRNPADGKIYSCQFVREFLNCLGVYDLSLSPPRGVIRLTMNRDYPLSLNKRIRLRFDNDNWQLVINDSRNSFVDVLQSFESPSHQDAYVLRQETPNSWVVDIPVWAPTAATLPDIGDVMSISESVEGLLSVTARAGFTAGVGPATLPELAQRASKIFTSASLLTRQGVVSFFAQRWADTVMVSPVISGDPEKPISGEDAVALPRPALDIYYRSGQDMSPFSERVKVRYVDVDGSPRLRGQLTLGFTPSTIGYVGWEEDESHIEEYNIYAFNESPGEPDFFGSGAESLWLDAAPTLDQFSIPTMVLEEDEGGPYAWITVKGLHDPHAESVRRAIESPDHAPPGLSVRLRQGPAAAIDMLLIAKRFNGASVDYTALRADIASYLLSIGSPAIPSVAMIHRKFQDHGLRLIQFDGVSVVRPSVATRLFFTSADPRTLDSDWWFSSYVINPIVTGDSMVPDETQVGIGDATFSATRNTVRYYLGAMEVAEQ